MWKERLAQQTVRVHMRETRRYVVLDAGNGRVGDLLGRTTRMLVIGSGAALDSLGNANLAASALLRFELFFLAFGRGSG
jgi:hypothetical protein